MNKYFSSKGSLNGKSVTHLVVIMGNVVCDNFRNDISNADDN